MNNTEESQVEFIELRRKWDTHSAQDYVDSVAETTVHTGVCADDIAEVHELSVSSSYGPRVGDTSKRRAIGIMLDGKRTVLELENARRIANAILMHAGPTP